jgi:hypothetical protein
MVAMLVTIEADLRAAFVKRLRRSIALAGLSEKQACAEMQIRQNQWSAQCAGEETHLSFTRLMLLPTSVHVWFALLTLIEFGLPVEVDAFLKLFKPHKAMARVRDLPELVTERKEA